MRDKIFISYCHIDAEYLTRLRKHLIPFERQDKIQVWSDTQIKPWDIWKDEIKKWLDQAAVAILLISADFLASNFIINNELPNILKSYKDEGVKIIPVILKPCAFFEHEILSEFQCVNTPSSPVIWMNEKEKEEIWYNVSKNASEYIKGRVVEWDQNVELEKILWISKIVETQNDNSLFWDWYPEFLSSEIENPDLIDEYYLYSYMHIDYLNFMPNALNYYFKNFKWYDILLEKVKERFKLFWWEWDWDIQFLWFPPFIWVWVHDTFWVLTFFVKQSNNGEAFICSPVPLTFSRLLEQQYRWK